VQVMVIFCFNFESDFSSARIRFRFHDFAVVGEVVEECGCHFGVTEHRWPFTESKVCLDDDTAAQPVNLTSSVPGHESLRVLSMDKLPLLAHRYSITDQSGETTWHGTCGYSARPSILRDLSSKVALFSLEEMVSLVAITSDFSASR